MKGVGYVSGGSLEEIQDQWCELTDSEVNVILFDREVLRESHNYKSLRNSKEQKDAIWRYMETMRAGQAVSNNRNGYQLLEDLVPGDTLVLTSLEALSNAAVDIWEEIFVLISRGVHLAILSEGFISSGPFGSNVLKMMDELYRLGQSAGLQQRNVADS